MAGFKTARPGLSEGNVIDSGDLGFPRKA